MERLIAPFLGERSGNLARTLIAAHGSLAAVLSADEALLGEELDGDDRAAALLATAREIHLFLLRERIRDREIVGNYADLVAYLRADLTYKRTEQVRVLYLSSANRLLRDEMVSEGCLDEAPSMCGTSSAAPFRWARARSSWSTITRQGTQRPARPISTSPGN